MPPMISACAVTKRYKSGLLALDAVDLEIVKGEIFALLGPNGAGKTTLIGVICGTVSMTSGAVVVDGHDVMREFRAARSKVGLVPQEIALDIFSTVWKTVSFSRRLFGRAPDPAFVERLLHDLSLWERRDSRILELSGGMKRRVMIAKALSHEPDVLFLDEPTAGVDVNLRRDMWALTRRLRDQGVTVILTTHYIEEAEEMADRVGVINRGRIVLVEDKAALMRSCRRCPPNSRAGRSSSRTTAGGSATGSTPPPRIREFRRFCGVSANSGSISRISIPRRAASRISLSTS